MEREVIKTTTKDGYIYEYEVLKGTHIMDGYCRNWWLDGNLRFDGYYSKGLKQGHCARYSSDRRMNDISVYDQDELAGERIVFYTGEKL